MAILIGLLEFISVLIIVIGLTTLIVWWYYRRRLAILLVENDQQQQTEIYDMVRGFRHQAMHCLRPIKDSLYLIKREAQAETITDSEKWQQLIRISLQDIEKYEWRLTRLIENMAFVSRLEVSDTSLRFSEIKLDAIVSDIVSDLNDLVEIKGINFTWWAKPENFPRMMGNEEGLRQVFINLIDNAAKYCNTKDEIDVSLEAIHEKNVIFARVSDSGLGIPEEDLNQIFLKGYTVEAARGRKPKAGSQGLGLYITKLVIEKHKGYIDVTSELGQGTTFTLVLPVHRI